MMSITASGSKKQHLFDSPGHKVMLQDGMNWLTRTRSFQKLTVWAFHTGQVNGTELYAGILLVHVQLAKYAGPAACYPPSRQVIEQLFRAADDDNSGFIDADEFAQIVVICCAQVASRIFVYCAIFVLLVPYLVDGIVSSASKIDDWLGWDNNDNTKSSRAGNESQYVVLQWLGSTLTSQSSKIAERVVGLILFYVLVPVCYNWIDRSSRKAAEITEAPNIMNIKAE
jgi:EF hand